MTKEASGACVRRLPFGAEVQAGGGVHFRVWAPRSRKVAVVFADDMEMSHPHEAALTEEDGGHWSGMVSEARRGMFYRYRLDSGTFPDPASRFQPAGPHGPSQIMDSSTYRWVHEDWKGVPREGNIIYEMHIGTFTQEGTWASAIKALPALVDLGVTLLEVMPVAEFPGRFGWGYDGVNLFAPTHLYGSPDDFRRFIDEAHGLGLGVILDVVYNHLGPDGNYVREFAEHYFSERYANEWGDALNFDDEYSGPVRELFISNAGYWIDEFRLDGLRLDATHSIHDASPRHLLADLSKRVQEAAAGRGTFIVAENEVQDTAHVRPVEKGGYGLDAMWNDDFHHSALVALTGRSEAYYTDYSGTPQELLSALKWGFLYQGQYYKWQKKRRGTPSLDVSSASFVICLENHDQVANSLFGRRLNVLTSRGRLRALTALLLLGPNTPMLFQGQEFASSAPFLYFADHHPELAQAVSKGRAEFLQQFPSAAAADAAGLIADPEKQETFLRCKLDFAERERHPEVLALHRDLIRLRKTDPILGKAVRGSYDGAVLGPASFVLRFFGAAQEDRLLIINLGTNLRLDTVPEPLLAPVKGGKWRVAWSSEDPRYGGNGTPPIEDEDHWYLPAEAAVLLIPDASQP